MGAKHGDGGVAAVPEVLVEQLIERLQKWGGTLVPEGPGVREEVIFSLPRELHD